MKKFQKQSAQFMNSPPAPKQKIKMLNIVLRPGMQYSFHAAPFSIPDIKKLDKKLISLTKKVYGLPQSTPNIIVQLPYKMFGMQATSFLTSYVRTLGDQLTQALNDKGQLGKYIKD